MLLDVRKEEGLKYLWLKEEGWERDELKPVLKYSLREEDFQHLEELGYARRGEDGWELTETGHREAARLIRSMRLAEWLFLEILRNPRETMAEAACKLEHVLNEETTDQVCTLLGHPRTCPHGRPIPMGRCCREQRLMVRPLFLPLSHLDVGEQARVVSIRVDDPRIQHVLASYGIHSGQVVMLREIRPQILLDIGGLVLALDREVADRIYVRPIAKTTPT